MPADVVQAPSGLWHIAAGANLTYCGKQCSPWPAVFNPIGRSGIWCGVCLAEAGGMKVERPA